MDRFAGFPFVELERLSARSRDPRSVFVPERFYGAGGFWMFSAGLRLRFGPLHARMGRYGAALAEGPPIRTIGNSETTTHHH